MKHANFTASARFRPRVRHGALTCGITARSCSVRTTSASRRSCSGTCYVCPADECERERDGEVPREREREQAPADRQSVQMYSFRWVGGYGFGHSWAVSEYLNKINALLDNRGDWFGETAASSIGECSIALGNGFLSGGQCSIVGAERVITRVNKFATI